MAFNIKTILPNSTDLAEATYKLDALEKSVLKNRSQNIIDFDDKIGSYFKLLKLTDTRKVAEADEVITELKSDMNFDKIQHLISAMLKKARQENDDSEIQVDLREKNIGLYEDIVNSAIEASRSYSTVAKYLSFSPNRASEGVFFFIFAVTGSLKNDSDFNDQIVTSTAVYCKIFVSIQDVKNQAGFQVNRIEKNSVNIIKTMQAALLDDLSNKKINYTTWKKLDGSYSQIVVKITNRIIGDRQSSSTMRIGSQKGMSPSNQLSVRQSIDRLKTLRNPKVNNAISISQRRLARDYF